MRNISKTILGALFAAVLLFNATGQEANAASATLSKKFYYQLNNSKDRWDYWTIDPHSNPYLVSTSNAENIAISYLQFLIDPAVTDATASLDLFLHDVSTSPNNNSGFLTIWRVNDQSVFDASSDKLVSDVGTIAPISLGTALKTLSIDDSNDNDSLVFDFEQLVSSSLVSGAQYLSFAIVADLDTATWIRAEQSPDLVNLSFPVPEPMSASYILLGTLAFAFRRVKNAVLGMFGLA